MACRISMPWLADSIGYIIHQVHLADCIENLSLSLHVIVYIPIQQHDWGALSKGFNKANSL
jgi:hypothetical protein